MNIPNSVTSIGVSAFFNCVDLTELTIPNSVYSISDNAFDNCKGLTSLTIGNSVTSIGKEAFYNCYKLTMVTIPNSVIEICDKAFNSCSGLTAITVDNDNPANLILGTNVFFAVSKYLCTLYVPKGSKELYAAADQWKDFTNIIEFEGDASVEGIIVDTQNDDIYYDLSGRRVVNPTHGIYIKNGQKVLVK